MDLTYKLMNYLSGAMVALGLFAILLAGASGS